VLAKGSAFGASMEGSMMLDQMYAGAEAEGNFVIYASSGIAAAATVAVLLRLLSRWKSRIPLAADDHWITASLAPLWCLVFCGIWSMYP
jgi:hypothetical protein